MKKINLRKITLQAFKRLPAHEKRITVATLFTLSRVIVSPLIIASMILGFWNGAFFLFLLAALTDGIDGTIARFWNQKTFLGASLDPVADKVLLLSCFSTLAFINTPFFHIPQWFVLFVLSKDLIQVTGAFLIYLIKGHLDVRPTMLGKITTFVQMIFIIWLFACYFFQWFPIKTYYTMLSIVSILVFASFCQYFYIGLNYVLGEE